MNKGLKDKIYTIPPLIVSGIQNALKKYDKNNQDKGVIRARNLLSGRVTYGQLKRILHDMKNFSKNNKTEQYNLAGGKPFESWGWATLNSDRDVLNFDKKMRKQTDEVGGVQGRKNAYNTKHRKKSVFNVTSPKASLKSNSETYTSPLKLSKLFEEITKEQKQ